MNHKQILTVIVQHGKELFGEDFPVQPAEALRGIRAQAKMGCAVSRQVLEHEPSCAPPVNPAPARQYSAMSVATNAMSDSQG